MSSIYASVFPRLPGFARAVVAFVTLVAEARQMPLCSIEVKIHNVRNEKSLLIMDYNRLSYISLSRQIPLFY